jgi:putative phosphonate transport system ATP-binding protein
VNGKTEAAFIPALRLEALTVRHGSGCPLCAADSTCLERNRCPRCGTVWAVRDISLTVREGETIGIVGESGSGKSTLMQAVYLDREVSGGTCYLASYQDGSADIFSSGPRQRKYIRGSLLGIVYQNPWMGLRMHFSTASNVAEKLIMAGGRHVGTMMERTRLLLDQMEVPVSRIREAPRNFSGGMQQRVQIARAVANNPPLLLLDEVTTGLDLSVQARVLDLVKGIQREFAVTMIVVSHDLAVVRMLADRSAVMLDGRIVEQGLTDQILEDPRHPYTQILVNSML